MSHPRTLPIRVDPIPGESLDSWLAALAYRLHTPVGDLLPELGLPRRSRGRTSKSDDIPPDWTVLLRPSEIDILAQATGVSPSTIQSLTLSRYDGHALLIDHATRQVLRWRIWGRNTGSRYCPDCLAETGGRWQLSWRLGWSFACTVHRRLLADVCPHCSRVPYRRLLTNLFAPDRCVQPSGTGTVGRSARRCGTHLTTAITSTFPENHPVLQAQDLVLDVINEGKAQFGIYATNPLPASTALSDLRALAGRILSHAERGDLNSMPRDLLADYDHAMAQPTGHNKPAHAIARPGAMAPAHAAITALGVTAAVTVLNSDTVRDAGTAIRWLIETSRQRGSTVTPSNIGSWGRGSSTTLKAVQLSALGPFLKPSDQLRYRTAADTPSHRLPADRASSRHHRIPARLWTTWALRLQPGTWPSLRILRPALSAALLLAGTRRTLSDATETLGAIIDSRDVSRSLMALEASPHWSHILIALTRLVDHLDAGDIPIDYHRRRELNYDDLLPADQWISFCRQTGFLTGQQRRLQLARCLLFEKISNMPAEKAPDSFRIDRSFNREQLHQFAARITPDLAEHLNAAAQDFLAHQGIAGEPVEWQPPVTLLDDLQLPGDTPTAVDINTLHRLVRDGRTSLSAAAQQLGTTLDVVRHLLDQHPAPPLPPTTSEQARATGQLRFAARTALPRELLTRLYCDQQHTLREIGRRIGVSRNIVSGLLDEYAIPRRQHNGPRPTIMISRDWLYDQYINHRRTLPDLARETGMSPSNMTRWAKRHNILLRPRGGAGHDQIRTTLAQGDTAPPILRPALVGHGAWDRLLRFAAVARYPTIGAAADALGLHQSALATQINRLEHDRGGALLMRAQRAHPMQLTPLGRRVTTAIASSAVHLGMPVTMGRP